jgi:hypothetical protein
LGASHPVDDLIFVEEKAFIAVGPGGAIASLGRIIRQNNLERFGVFFSPSHFSAGEKEASESGFGTNIKYEYKV